jgi:hypothetical protein
MGKWFASYLLMIVALSSCNTAEPQSSDDPEAGFDGSYTGTVTGNMIAYGVEMTLSKTTGSTSMPGFDSVSGTIVLSDSGTAPLLIDQYPPLTGNVTGHYGYEAPAWGLKLYFWSDSISYDSAKVSGKLFKIDQCIYDRDTNAFAGKCYGAATIRMYKVQ